MGNNQKYSICRLNIQPYKCKPKKCINNIRCKYLAKSHVIKANAHHINMEFANFRGSYFTKVSFKNSKFYGDDFWGTSFNNCTFKNVAISNSVFVACRFKKCTFENVSFSQTVFVNTDISECLGIDTTKGVLIFTEYPKVDMTNKLIDILNSLKDNKHLRKNKLLHLRKNRFNNLNIYLLIQKFGENVLCKKLQLMKNKTFKNITTYAKLERELKKL